ncbi:hypothetical protein [Micromonospora sp. NPDC049204]|uniref:hypothetical protein n=1 Tax=Micromonospora sp. NPDC049204 TaxID=3154351 RepID=UPI0033EEDB42
MNAAAELDALRRSAKIVNALAWGVVALIMVYGTPIVFRYLVDHDVPKATAWMLSLAADGALAVGLVATPILAQHNVSSGWVGALRWVAGFATWALNTSDAWDTPDGPDVGGIISHTWGPLLMFAAVEGAAYFGRKISAVIREKEAEVAKRVDDLAALHTRADEAERKTAEVESLFRAEQRARVEADERAKAAEAARTDADAEREKEAAARADERQKATAQITLLKSEIAAIGARHQQRMEEVQASARDARTEAAKASDVASRTAGQLEEARLLAERAITEKANAEQHAAAVTAAHQAQGEELARARQAYERLSRKTADDGRQVPARQSRKRSANAGSADRQSPAIIDGADRQTALALPAGLPTALPVDPPEIEGVRPERVAAVLLAYRFEPGAKRERTAELAGVSVKTVQNVMNRIPDGHPVLAINEDADQAAG